MTTKSHWGVWVDSEIPVTGVLQTNKAEFISEEFEDGIDLGFEEHLLDCLGQCRYCRCTHDGNPDRDDTTAHTCTCGGFSSHYYTPVETDHEHCAPESGVILIGSWKKDRDGKYEPDQTGTYAAIVGEIYTQVVYSKYTQRARLCSPCYPGQGDLDGGEGEFLAYTLPPEVWGREES